MPQLTTKTHIIDIADKLFYEQGYENTSFAHIAEQVGISRGNFYHHFKTKDDLLRAVIDKRLAKTAGMLEAWQLEAQTPVERIKCFINILIMNRAKIKHYGCPVGTLMVELSKLDHPSLSDANKVFDLFAKWLSTQFMALGKVENAEELALHLLARSQGIATVASAFRSEDFLYKEVEVLKQWLESAVS